MVFNNIFYVSVDIVLYKREKSIIRTTILYLFSSSTNNLLQLRMRLYLTFDVRFYVPVNEIYQKEIPLNIYKNYVIINFYIKPISYDSSKLRYI